MIELFFRFWPLQPADPWKKVDAGFARLRAWGFGWEDDDAGYRNRLRRLCRFLLDLSPQENGGSGHWPQRTDFEKLELALAPANRNPPLAEILEALQEVQRRTVPGPGGKDRKEETEVYLARLESGLAVLRQQPGESAEHHATRRTQLEKILKKLGLPPAAGARQDRYLPGLINGLRRDLVVLRATLDGAAPRVDRELARLGECLEDCIADWEWAYLQVLVRLAKSAIKENLAAGAGALTPVEAQQYLRDAIRGLERGKYIQVQTQGLYGVLAESYLGCARSEQVEPTQRVKLLRQGLAFAKRCVESEPERARERLALLRILSALKDFDEMKAEAEIALNLDFGSETLRTVGAGYWERATPLRRAARRKVLREAADFFAEALRQAEGTSFDESKPLAQAEAHGWAHFWRGRFLCELGSHDNGVQHLRIASELGFKPLESRVELAWGYYLARDLKSAEQAFASAVREAQRERSARAQEERPLGEERSVEDLELDAYLGWGLLTAERAPELAEGRLQHVRERLQFVPRSRQDLEAALGEARGRALLNLGELDSGVAALEEAVKLSPRSGAYCSLGMARLELSQGMDGKARADAVRKAHDAYRLAREADARGRYGRELWQLRGRLRQLEKAAAAGAAPADQQPAQTPPAPTKAAPAAGATAGGNGLKSGGGVAGAAAPPSRGKRRRSPEAAPRGTTGS